MCQKVSGPAFEIVIAMPLFKAGFPYYLPQSLNQSIKRDTGEARLALLMKRVLIASGSNGLPLREGKEAVNDNGMNVIETTGGFHCWYTLAAAEAYCQHPTAVDSVTSRKIWVQEVLAWGWAIPFTWCDYKDNIQADHTYKGLAVQFITSAGKRQ